MEFNEIAMEYENTFGEFPPVLTTLDIENEEYLKMLKEAIENNDRLTKNDLAEVFMQDDELLY